MGVTRKALRIYEEKGLMPKNEGGQYRSYDDEDIDRIWAIKILQGMGYSLNEIVDLANAANGDEFDFQKSISQKVIYLEEKKAEADRLLGYAKMIQLTGRCPSRPKEFGSITFCDGCNDYLNAQPGFDRKGLSWVCTKCGFNNDTTFRSPYK